MGKLQKPQNRKPRRRSSFRYRCSVCMYTSSRRYNILRHELRIHSACTRPRKCCDVLLKTKGEYYSHCEEHHPNSRLTNITSRNKYKILPKCMNSQSSTKTNPVRVTSVTLISEVHQGIPYMLRSRVRPKLPADDTNIILAETVSPKSLKTAYESNLEDVPVENNVNVHESSGYESKTSIDSTSDSTGSYKIKLSYSEKRNEWEALQHEQLPCLDDTSEKAVEESNEPSPIKFCKNDETTAGYGGNSEPLDLTKTSVYRAISDSDRTKSDYMRSSTAENEFEENCYSGTLSTSTPCHLPPKKRMLLSLGFSNRINIANASKPIGDRLCLAKPQNLEETLSRKKHRLSKKMKYRKSRKGIALSSYSSASSDAENVSPLTAQTARKQKSSALKVDLCANGRFTWDKITQLMRERLRLIDFDSFKAIPR